jgi:hypothetical protein
MKIIEKDGEKRYKWEDSDLFARRQFENRAIGGPETDAELLAAFLRAMSKLRADQAEAWRIVKGAIESLDPDYDGHDFAYNWALGEFYSIKERKE